MQWLLLGLSVILLAAGNVSTLLDRYRIAIQKVKVNWLETLATAGKQIVLDVTIGIINPTTTRVKIKSIAIVLYYKNVKIGTAFKQSTIDVINNATTPVNAIVTIDVANAIQSVKPALMELFNRQQIDVVLKGYVDFGIAKVPFNTPYKVEV